jgi:hypothetical protein
LKQRHFFSKVCSISGAVFGGLLNSTVLKIMIV